MPSTSCIEYSLATLPVQVDKSGLEEVCKEKDEVLSAKERALSDERQRVSSLSDECAILKGKLEGKTEEIESLQTHSRTLQVKQIVEGAMCILQLVINDFLGRENYQG